VVPALCAAATLAAQDRSTVERERREYAQWLTTSPASPYATLAIRPIGPGLTLGPAQSDIPLEGAPYLEITEQEGMVLLEQGGNARTMSRYRPVTVGAYRLVAEGVPGRPVLAVYAERPRNAKAPTWYGYDPALVLEVTLSPPAKPGQIRLLAPDGREVQATEAGTVTVKLYGRETTLRVRRLPEPGDEESSLEIFFRDATNDRGTYPAGRFVALTPGRPGRFVLDLNRARNPWCAYSTIYACPAPWRGNVLLAGVAAGEQYAGGGLQRPTPPDQR
jgi:hypothetical protein